MKEDFSEQFIRQYNDIKTHFRAVGTTDCAYVEIRGNKLAPVEFTEDGVFTGRTTGRDSATEAEDDLLDHLRKYTDGKHELLLIRIEPELKRVPPWERVIDFFFERYCRSSDIIERPDVFLEDFTKYIKNSSYDLAEERFYTYCRCYAE